MSDKSRPINLEDFKSAIKELPDDTVISTGVQLRNSLEKLNETQAILRDEIDAVTKQMSSSGSSTHLDEDLKLYKESLEENDSVIQSQSQRVAAIDDELIARGFKDVKITENELGVLDL